MTGSRLTRDEKRAQTRESLMEAASVVFARRGYHAASLDDIAEAAGFSKGAIYSNFESKEDLFLAVLQRHDEEQRATLALALGEGHTLAERLENLGRWFRLLMETERDWALLTLEFTMYAARNPKLRDALAEREAESLRSVTALIGHQASELGLDLPADPGLLAEIVLALGSGLSERRLLADEALRDDLFPTAVALVLGLVPERARGTDDG